MYPMAKTWVVKFEVGDKVHHWQTGRTGTVLEKHENGQITIEFELMNAAGMKDGRVEKRNRNAFNLGLAPGVAGLSERLPVGRVQN